MAVHVDHKPQNHLLGSQLVEKLKDRGMLTPKDLVALQGLGEAGGVTERALNLGLAIGLKKGLNLGEKRQQRPTGAPSAVPGGVQLGAGQV